MSDGGKTDFYDLKGCKDVDDLAEMLDLRGDEFNCLKAIFGIAIARKTGNSRHKGTSIQRDGNKLAHYANRIQSRVHKNEPTIEGASIVPVDSIEHFAMIIDRLYEDGICKTPHGGDYEEFLKDFTAYIREHHDNKIKVAVAEFNTLAVIELL